MTVTREVSGPIFYFDRARLRALGASHRDAYRAAKPYAHAVLDELLGDSLSRALAARFPGPAHSGWVRRDYAEQTARLGQLQRTGFEAVDPSVRHFMSELQGMAFLDFLGALTGIDGVIGDPHFRGPVPSAALPGGDLAPHAGFKP